MSKAHIPVEPIWLWEYIADELNERGWTIENLALEMGGDFAVNLLSLEFIQAQPQSPLDHEIQDLRLGSDMAEKLSTALGVDASTWLRLHESCRLSVVAQLRREAKP